MVAVFNEIEDLELLTVEKVEILNFWGYGIEINAQIDAEDMKKIFDRVELEEGRTLC